MHVATVYSPVPISGESLQAREAVLQHALPIFHFANGGGGFMERPKKVECLSTL